MDTGGESKKVCVVCEKNGRNLFEGVREIININVKEQGSKYRPLRYTRENFGFTAWSMQAVYKLATILKVGSEPSKNLRSYMGFKFLQQSNVVDGIKSLKNVK
eukprot:Pompholyxophrys_punicea_v1_NODE_150_length_3179_cov_6.395006.p3 type:complete len:103 gc:universal NODE_150_length_3179_cov_6.395006:921-1229(+)